MKKEKEEKEKNKKKEEIIVPPVCRGVYIRNYVMRFSSNNPCDWLKFGRDL